jgi:hypothetical protein
VTKKGTPDFVPPAERIATFDNDGTLWAEQPLYFQFLFALDRVKALAPQHPEWQTKEPFASLLKGDMQALPGRRRARAARGRAATHSGMTSEEFMKTAKDWLATARHPKTHLLYTEMVVPADDRAPRLPARERVQDVHRLRRRRRVHPRVRRAVYGIPPEQVVGSVGKQKFEMRPTEPVLLKLPDVLFVDDGPASPSASGCSSAAARRRVRQLGRRPRDAAVDRGGTGARFCLYVHHDDAEREWAYDRDSKIGRLDKGLDEAKAAAGP